LIVAGTACVGAAAPSRSATAKVYTQTLIGPARLLSPDFGYVVESRIVNTTQTQSTTFGLFIYDHGHWRDATPPIAKGVNEIDDVTFSDPNHGWIAEYDCGNVHDYVYRTADGGRTWHFLGRPTIRSCGGGPTFLSFVDSQHGWMEGLEPNAPGGSLSQTNDGGVSWKAIPGRTIIGLPCLGPVRFVSRTTGWLARCDGHLFVSRDAGAHWSTIKVKVKPDVARSFDLPRFGGEEGAIAAILGGKTASKVAFFTSSDGGGSWLQQALRPVAPCPLRTGGGFYQTFWPESAASQRVWWIVSGRKHVTVQMTQDAGRHWSSVAASGLSGLTCSVTSVSAAGPRVAWVVATTSSRYAKQLQATITSTWLFTTSDGGRTWERAPLKPQAKLSS
jgi:photosystem II stability/assembly factor-like uncharacterized protein